MKISLIISAYNEEKYIEQCLTSILKYTSDKIYEIIVVDNNSKDKTVEIVKKFPQITLIIEPKQGANYARQRGFEASTGDIIVFIDADTIMTKKWINILISEFDKNSKMVCLSGPFIYYDFSKLHKFGTLIYWYIFAFPIYLYTGYMGMMGNLAIKKNVLEKMGGIDTSIFYGDDTNITKRASKFGKVKFKLNFTIYSSARRMKGQGLFNTLFHYVLNFWSQVFFKKSVTKKYKEVR